MYAVKDSGRGGLKLYEPAMQERVQKGAGGIYLGFDTPDECWEGQARMWECFGKNRSGA